MNENFVVKVGNLSMKRDMKTSIKKLVFENDIDAIFFQTNTLAEEGLKQLKILGMDVLDKIEVVAFDQNSTYHFLEKSIPYINQPIKKMGQNSVKMLINQIEGRTNNKNTCTSNRFFK